MDKVIYDLSEFTSAYMYIHVDDPIAFSASWEEHLAGIRKVLAKLEAAGLCESGANKCKYLGHIMGNGVVEPDHRKYKLCWTYMYY